MSKRGQNEGSVFQRTDGRWTAVVNLGWENGRRRRKYFYGVTRAEVQEKLVEALRSKQLGLPVAPERQTVAQFLDQWLNDVARPNTRPKTFEQYEYAVRVHLKPDLGRVPLAKLAVQRVQSLLKAKSDAGLSPKTVKHIRDTLRNALNVAVEWDLVARNVAAKAKPPHIEEREVKVFTPDDARHFLKLLQGHRLEALFSTVLCIGLRRGEALGLKWRDVDLEAGTLMVRNSLQRVAGKLRLGETKTPKSRAAINLPQVAVSALYRHRARQEEERVLAGSHWVDSGFIFSTRIGTPLDPRNVLRAFYSIMNNSGLPRLRFHDLRHCAATLLLVQGVHPRVVMDLLRHTTVSITMNLYSHVIPALRKEAADKMDEILNPVAVSVAVKAGLAKTN